MVDAKKDKILDRVVKLFKLGSADANTTEAEMMLAISRAKEMMARHNLSMAEAETKLGTPEHVSQLRDRVKEYTAYTRKISDFAYYDYNVASCVMTLTGTRAIVSIGKQQWNGLSTMRFIGMEEDVGIAAEIFIIFLEAVRRAARSTYGSGWSARHTAYAIGFSSRMARRAQEVGNQLSREEATTMALVVQGKSQAIDDYLRNKGVGQSTRKPKIADGEAYARGYTDGANMNLTVKRTMK
jgi:ubiquitin